MAREDTSLLADSLEKGTGQEAYGTIRAHAEEAVSSGDWRAPQRHLYRQLAITGVTISSLMLTAGALLALTGVRVHTQLELWGLRPAPVRFLNLGDWGRGGAYNQSVLAEQMGVIGERLGAQFVVSNGDNFYDEGLTGSSDPFFHLSFTKVYTASSLQTQWYSVLGNHDYYGNVLAQLSDHLTNRDPRWLCQRSGTFSKGLCSAQEGNSCAEEVQFFLFDTVPMVKSYRNKSENSPHRLDWSGIDTTDWEAYNSRQLQELAFNLEQSTARWKIVIGHHPVYSFGHHGDQSELIQLVKPVLERYGADVWVNGHDHDMQHIKRNDSPVHFFTSGGGSKAFTGVMPPKEANGLQFYWEGQGFAAFHVGREYLKVEYYGVFGDLMYSTVLRK